MPETHGGARILVVDDDPGVLASIQRMLGPAYEVFTAASGEEALAMVEPEDQRPDLVLLDVRMPGLDGYEVCARLHRRAGLAYVPVVFVTALGSEQDRERAFAVGAADHIQKPFERENLLEVVRHHLDTGRRWSELNARPPQQRHWLQPSTYVAFRRHLVEERRASPPQVAACAAVGPTDVYALTLILRMPQEQLARYLARFLGLPYVERPRPEELGLGVLPTAFCAANLVLPLADGSVAVANPFDWGLMEVLDRTVWRGNPGPLVVADPERIRDLCRDGAGPAPQGGDPDLRAISLERDASAEHEPAVADAMTVVNEILRDAIAEGASDVHLEPKDHRTLVRFRLDGDMHDVRSVDPTSATKAMSRLKALAGMDIAERRKPQDGAMVATLGDRYFKLRLATSSTTRGESLVIRLLEPGTAAVPLEDLGMTDAQADEIRGMADRHQGMVLVVGSTGSGKSTTIFTLLTTVDGQRRSIMSVEDPVEYRIPYANQQQVREKAGVTFDALLRSAMRQDPDILFLGEIRDPYSARAALDFASSGHLTISTLHSSNATTAIFRLERLGVERSAMSDSITAIVAQKLLKKLCPHCKEIGPPTEAEEALLAPFTDDIPSEVARPKGCPACRETGYRGRAGVFEILRFDPDVAHMVRTGAPIAEIRAFCGARGDYLIWRHALDCLRRGTLSVKDVHEHILLEELMFHGRDQTELPAPPPRVEDTAPPEMGDATPPLEPLPGPTAPLVLVVDDDPDMRALLELHLSGSGYRVETAVDGVDALLALGRRDFDLVLSDINMPNLDGVKLLEMITQKGISVPTIFVTGEDDDDLEAQVLSYGAADYIRKPVRKDAMLLRVKRAIGR